MGHETKSKHLRRREGELVLVRPYKCSSAGNGRMTPLLTYVEEVQVPELSKLLIQRTEHAWIASFALFV